VDIYQILSWVIGTIGGIFGIMWFFKFLYEHYFFKKRTRMGYIQEVFRVYNTFSLFLRELEKTKDKESLVKEVQTRTNERWRYLFHDYFYNVDSEIYSKWIDVKNNLGTKSFDSCYKNLLEMVNGKLQY
jgi:hypothetical protein